MTEENSNPSDRFDLEQFILDCWKVTDDSKLFNERSAESEDWQALARYYEHKFDRLWALFEKMTQDRNIR